MKLPDSVDIRNSICNHSRDSSNQLLRMLTLPQLVETCRDIFQTADIRYSKRLPNKRCQQQSSHSQGRNNSWISECRLTLINPASNKPVASFVHLTCRGLSSGCIFITTGPHTASLPRNVYTIVDSVLTSSRAGSPLSKRMQMRCPPLGENDFWASWMEPFSEML